MSHNKNNPIRNAILGLATGDALGVPVEFLTRERLQQDPVKEITGYGTHHQPPGTWSDDTSLSLCLLEVMGRKLSVQDLAENFKAWLFHNKFTPHGEVFDVGHSTMKAITRLKEGVDPTQAGNSDEASNGNGALMRILPLVFHLKQIEKRRDRFFLIKDYSSITHGHIRSSLSCYYYLEFAAALLRGDTFSQAYLAANTSFEALNKEIPIPSEELEMFKRVLSGKIAELPREQIQSDGYVIHTLEASTWCLLNTHSYAEAVLMAVNLGSDTDTTGAVTGGLAGLYYGADNIPKAWLAELAGLDEIERLVKACSQKYPN